MYRAIVKFRKHYNDAVEIRENTLEDLSVAYCKVIANEDLGASNVFDTWVFDNTGAEIGHISYNGRIWPMPTGNLHKDVERKPIYDNRITA